ncbi:flagellar filament capping protein FliD [Bythopirellula polymerisocia]|uniref:Filament cap protein n=1 Tax=Bythopirellula polymerisocia TaxID=2528003 RepID=A0A5C6CLR9_9BACT|nr:flagellar filament capping protein FliD [Bythopirellula polymerisocia]TWU25560.1 Flagellar hook-associated protein 2 [Bythopirellula polymerisocia]
MGRITSNVGLVSGLPISDIVDQLIQISSTPRNILAKRTEDLQTQQVAIGTLSAKLISIQFSLGKLTSPSLYAAKKATSSDATALTATVADSSKLVNSTYSFTPVRTASSQQLVSQRFDSKDSKFSAQNFEFRTGGFVDKGISLEELNGGLGVRLGQIRITDKSGESDVIDLRFAATIDDVLNTINANSTINVTAKTVGDTIQLVDNTGQSGTLSVQEVNNGKTALDLGLSAISASGATSVATGNDVFYLHTGTRLSKLNDGTGVNFTNDVAEVDDLVFEFADESGPIGLDLSGATTLGDVVNAINDSTDLAGKITAAISADGNRLELTDLTSGGGTFSVSNGVLGTAADDLGLTKAAIGNTISGARLVSGLRDTLLSSLNGGSGIQSPGNLEITNLNGVFSVIDLSAAETLSEVIDAINGQATEVTAQLSENRGGIVLTDNSEGSTSNFIVASESGSTIAEDLGIAHDSATAEVASGVLNRQLVSEATLLTSLRGGRGIATLGDITITDTAGVKKTIDLNQTDAEVKTLGDVIAKINSSILGVEARINDTGDGLILVDTAGGAGKITVVDTNGTVATDLNLLGSSVELDINGTPTQVLDGTSINSFAIEEDDTLSDIVKKINDLGAGVTASLLNDGQGVRLSLTVDRTGAANALLLDFDEANFQFQEISKAQDALLQFGTVQAGAGGILVTSATNTFKEVVSGLNLNIQKASSTPVSITVASNDTGLVTAAEDFVASYNALRDELESLTSFDETAQTTGLLFGTGEALRVDTQLSRLITDRHFGLGSFQTLGEVGIKVNQDGKLELDKAKFQEAYQKDPTGLQTFFGDDEKGGVASKLDTVVEQLTGFTSGLLTNRTNSLQSTIDNNNDRIAQLDAFLERQRETLLLQYAQLESILSKFQATQSALSAFSPVPPLGTVA